MDLVLFNCVCSSIHGVARLWLQRRISHTRIVFFFWLFDNKKRFLPALVKTFEEVVKSLSSTGGRFVKGKVR